MSDFDRMMEEERRRDLAAVKRMQSVIDVVEKFIHPQGGHHDEHADD